MKWLNYHHLYYFWTIANEGSIAKASKKLLLGQPTLSTQLKQLEDTLGQPLFDRKNRQMVLTESGQVAFEYANEIFHMGSEMMETLQDQRPASRPHLQVGVLDSVPKHLTLQLVTQALQKEKCTLSILDGKGDELLRELLAHRIDLILSNYPPSISEDVKIFARNIAKVPVVVCGTKEFRNLKKGFPGSLWGAPFIMPTYHSKLRHDVDHYFHTQRLHIDIVAEAQDTIIQKMIAASGAGLTPIARAGADDHIREKKLIEIGRLPGVYEEIWLISASRKIENPAAARIMKNFQIR